MNLYPNDNTNRHVLSRGQNKVDDNSELNTLCSYEILSDKDSKGKERDWKGKKKRSLLMAAHHAEIDELFKKRAM